MESDQIFKTIHILVFVLKLPDLFILFLEVKLDLKRFDLSILIVVA